jgi:hypothetical protein
MHVWTVISWVIMTCCLETRYQYSGWIYRLLRKVRRWRLYVPTRRWYPCTRLQNLISWTQQSKFWPPLKTQILFVRLYLKINIHRRSENRHLPREHTPTRAGPSHAKFPAASHLEHEAVDNYTSETCRLLVTYMKSISELCYAQTEWHSVWSSSVIRMNYVQNR